MSLITRPLMIVGRYEIECELDIKHDISHLVSIRDLHSDEPSGISSVPNLLTLEFDDITIPRHGYVAVTDDQIQQIIDFGRQAASNLDNVKTFVCHCEAGVSRSAAAMYIILFDSLGRDKEAAKTAYKTMRQIRSFAHPNALMLERASKLLNLDDAVSTVFRFGG